MRELHLASARILAGAIAVLALGAGPGCSHKHPPTIASGVAPVPSGPTTDAKPATQAADTTPQPVSSHVAVADDLAKQCALALAQVDEAPKFDFDRFDLLPDDRDVLDKIATCVTTGPLKGRSLRLVGRADPRGTEEYNLGLGTRRANVVGSYLQRMGVKQLTETTRGALDASGRDETSWRLDRRVDLSLTN